MNAPVAVSTTRVVIGWCAVVVSLVASCFWAWFGTLENFHEGWWASSLSGNLWITLHYLSPAAILTALALMAVRWPWIGGTLFVVAGVGVLVWWIGYEHHREFSLRSFPIIHLTAFLLGIVGLAYLLGRPRPRWPAMGLLLGMPLAVFVACAAEPVWRISHRVDDGITSARRVSGNGVELMWAPAGPGWPDRGPVSFAEAQRIAAHLTEDGLSCASTLQNIWRLPTIDEAVRSLTRNGRNAGGEWNSQGRQASYRVMADKESPLWHVHSPVVYWWTSSHAPDDKSYVIAFNGRVKESGWPMDSLAFRAVKAR